MKKLFAVMLVLALAFSAAACNTNVPADTDPVEDTAEVTEPATDEVTEPAVETDAPVADVTVMTYDEYVAAAIDAEVVVETYVQGKQSWWDNKGTFYTQDENGGYFLYEMACTEDEYNALTVGTKIRVTGFKAEWAGEVEIVDAKFEILEGSYIAEPMDATALLGTDELINHQNKLVSFADMTVKAIEYKNGTPGDDIYVTLASGETECSFCVEVYLTGEDTDVYTTVGTLAEGDVVDVEAFLYWYEGANPHITAITKK